MKFFQNAILALALAACSPPATKNAAAPTATATELVHAKGRGEVVVLQPEYGAVTIRHEAIPEYGMGAMTMEFTTAYPAQLSGLKVGDKVRFELTAPTEIETIKTEKIK